MQTSRFKLIIFDLDGTLIDAFEDIAAAANFVRERNGLPPMEVDEVKLHVGHGARYLVEGVLGSRDAMFIDENLAALVGYYENLTESRAKIYHGVVDTLKALRGHGIVTAIASNKPHSVTGRVVESLGLAPYFEVIQGETAEINRKPAPDVLLKIMEDAGIPRDQTLMVGDSEIDVAAAKAARVKVAAVTYGQHSHEKLAELKPDFLLATMAELVPVVLNS